MNTKKKIKSNCALYKIVTYINNMYHTDLVEVTQDENTENGPELYCSFVIQPHNLKRARIVNILYFFLENF